MTLVHDRAEVSFCAGGPLGTHYVYLIWKGRQEHSRYINFRLDCETSVETGDTDLDNLYPFTRDAMRLARREYDQESGKFVGYTSADTLHFDGVWLRDWIYGLPAYRYWETAMTCGLDRFLEQQTEDGMIPDGIERDGRTWRVGLESDVEYILVLGVWQAWQATGDDAWMKDALPRLERALQYIRSDKRHWNSDYNLVKRQHSCDTWDFDIAGAADAGYRRHVIATCDQSGYLLAFRAMSRMYAHLGKNGDAERWAEEADAYRERANNLLWDGTKFLHHTHIDDIDHGDFDESTQLAMGNTWAMTRGLAKPGQAQRIIDEYRRRHEETGDAHPWWSLQPGYPDYLGYFRKSCLKQGGYANGGLMPWVGGELCRAAFLFGYERYGVELLRDYMDHLNRTGGVHVWYWPNGQAGFRTPNEVPYAPWGMGEWTAAMIEGLAGVKDMDAQFETVELSPRWTASAVKDARVHVRYAASNAYIAYHLQIDEDFGQIRFTYTGSGENLIARILLPAGWELASVIRADQEIYATVEEIDASQYVRFSSTTLYPQTVLIHCRKTGN